MRYLASALSVICGVTFAFVSMGTAQVKLDYSIVESFESKCNDISESIKKAATVQECGAVSADIDRLEKDFAPDTVLLNDALYPDKYDKWISELRFELHLSQDKMGIIETQGSHIGDLAEQVRILSGRVDSIAIDDKRLMSSINVMSAALAKVTSTLDSLTNTVGRLQPKGSTRQSRKPK
ncbi:MAG TPA: hypothetical protein VLX91_15625 [Candidatus Acidoferrales bacterium]|nr:hypothetical protein [Candidatus Acidoferrales bacterium]